MYSVISGQGPFIRGVKGPCCNKAQLAKKDGYSLTYVSISVSCTMPITRAYSDSISR